MSKVHHGMSRRQDVLKFIENKDGIGIELGVAEGAFSEMILTELKDHKFFLVSVDMWAGDRGHNIDEYRNTIKRLWPHRERNAIFKMTFGEALPMFVDEFFDFIYVDGYAHTGEGNGSYFRDWWPKLKPGGIMAGDDYHTDWPLVIQAVDNFADEINREVNIIPNTEKANKWSQYPTWFVRK